MIISCSSCDTSYEVEASYFEPDGRKVKCSSCATVWFQKYIRPEDVQEPEEVDDFEANQATSTTEETSDRQQSLDEPGEDDASDDIKSEAQRLVAAAHQKKAGRQRHKKQLTSAVVGWGALAATIMLVAGLSVAYRQNIVKMLPSSARLYAQLGMPVNVRGMSFANVVYKRDFENGLPVLAIKGEVVNLTDRQLVLPRVRFGLLDQTDKELYYWTVRVDKKPLDPKARVKFATRLASPPAGAKGLIVRFAKATSGYGAYR
jgi:predicted Zn finger-like uncharacterized protein